MKRKLLLFGLLLSFGLGFAQTEKELSPEEKARRERNIQAGNPFKKFGYKPKIATLSKGKYLEFHDLDSIVRIGSYFYHVKNKKLTGYEMYENKNSEATLRPELTSRWLSPDPLAEEFPEWSPYTFTFNNPVRYTDPTGLAPEDMIPPGDFYNENGKYLGTDGIDDGKVYVVKTTESSFDSGVSSAGISRGDYKATKKFIKNNSGNTSAFESNSMAYDNSVELVGGESVRQSMVNTVNNDNGRGGTSDANNREYGGVVRNGEVIVSPAGPVGNPKTDLNAFVTHPDVRTGDILFHSHPSGQIIEGAGANSSGTTIGGTTTTYQWGLAPSTHDVRNASGTGYVFSRRNGTIYIYNSSGVIATFPQKSFVTPKK